MMDVPIWLGFAMTSRPFHPLVCTLLLPNSTISGSRLAPQLHGAPLHNAPFRRNIARTLDTASTARYERTFAPNSSRENSCANRRRTSTNGAPVRTCNELIARSCRAPSSPGSKRDFIENLILNLRRMLRRALRLVGALAHRLPLCANRRITPSRPTKGQVCRIEARWTHAGDQNRRGAISRATAYPLKASRTLADLRVSVDPKASRCSRPKPATA
jgi:hypothetical protein